jgi:putative ABC transport system substrate-binding protein
VIDRRAFLGTVALAVLAAPRLGEARGAARRHIPRIGVLGEVSPIPWTVRTPVVDVECRWAGAQRTRLPELAAELVALDFDVIVALGATAARAAAQHTSRVPIVVVVEGDGGDDAVVASLARTARNITWLSVPSEAAMTRQRVALLAAVVPRLRRVAVLSNPDPLTNAAVPARADALPVRASDPGAGPPDEAISVAARTLEDVERALPTLAHEAIDGLLVPADTPLAGDAARLIALLMDAKMPAVYGARVFGEVGGLLAVYGDTADTIRRTASVVGRILAGAPPATLPPQRLPPQVACNLAAAWRLGLVFPPTLLARADIATTG